MRQFAPLALSLLAASPASQMTAQLTPSSSDPNVVLELNDGTVLVADEFEVTVFPDWWTYFDSAFF